MIKKILCIIVIAFAMSVNGFSQCNTTTSSPNTAATSCLCLTASQTDCDLRPDITISWHAILNYQSGPNQNPAAEKLNVTGATPNIGVGPLTVEGRYNNMYYYVCGTDTFTNATNNYTCPDGSNPKQLVRQRVWHKNGSTMSYYDRPAGTMTYHSGHGHYHVDDWGVFTLRYQIATEPDPRNWPIVATGAKLGFCLMDYFSCDTSVDIQSFNHCKDVNTVYNQGNNLYSSPQLSNYGLGGGSYACGSGEQGISAGWEDVYDEGLALMWINMPANLCNGQYWIVMEVDPQDWFLESDETNNYTAVPYTITQWNATGTAQAHISLNRQSARICTGETVTLTANAGSAFLWSTGATTQSITVNTAGTYNVTVTGNCGSAVSSPVNVEYIVNPDPVTTDDLVCGTSGSGTVTATGSGIITWRDSANNILGTGSSYTTPVITQTTAYFATTTVSVTDTSHLGPAANTFGLGGNVASAQYEIFNVTSAVKLLSVKVYANAAGNRTIELQDNNGAMIQTITVNLPAGESRVTLNWNIPAGNGYRLAGTGATNMYRNNSLLVAYPYTISGVISITGSSAGATYYYFFYDWEIETYNVSCTSNVIPATVVVDPCLSVGSNPMLNHNITVYPNPATTELNVNFSLSGTISPLIEVFDVLGKNIYSKHLENISGLTKFTFETTQIGKGIYTLRINVDGKTFLRKLVIN